MSAQENLRVVRAPPRVAANGPSLMMPPVFWLTLVVAVVVAIVVPASVHHRRHAK